jgi:hypothetical protein
VIRATKLRAASSAGCDADSSWGRCYRCHFSCSSASPDADGRPWSKTSWRCGLPTQQLPGRTGAMRRDQVVPGADASSRKASPDAAQRAVFCVAITRAATSSTSRLTPIPRARRIVVSSLGARRMSRSAPSTAEQNASCGSGAPSAEGSVHAARRAELTLVRSPVTSAAIKAVVAQEPRLPSLRFLAAEAREEALRSTPRKAGPPPRS